MDRRSFTNPGKREQENLITEDMENQLGGSQRQRNSEVLPKKKSRKKKFKNFIKRICCMGPTRTTDPMVNKQSKPESFWKAVLDNQIDRQFIQNAEKAVPNYFRDAQ